MPDTDPAVVVIGVGVAGLGCALDLVAAGVPVQILDAPDGVGGRMRTDRRGGFQVFNASYPQVKRRIDLRALQLRGDTGPPVRCRVRWRPGPVPPVSSWPERAATPDQ